MKNLLLIAVVLVAAFAVAGDQPQITNAKVEQRSATGGIEQQVRTIPLQSGPVWIAYSEPVIAGNQTMCCFGSDDHWNSERRCGCKLSEKGSSSIQSSSTSHAQLEQANVFYVFLRVSNGHVEKVRMFSANCSLDGSGMTVYWLNDVKPADSVAYLSKLAENTEDTDRKNDVASGAVAAIAMHADTSADAALAKLISTGHNEHLVEEATFWAGTARGSRGYEIIAAELDRNQNRHFRKHAIFALSQNSDPRAQKKIIDMARHDSDSDIRGESLFWLSQEAGNKAAGVISEAIENDPNTDVKKKAVFALSQLSNEEGVPLLIDQAKKNPNPIVRKEAIFWLGQSGDPRALDYIASVLEH